ncbi:MAG: M48 family metallopeptidase [Betaproteobacteria bacterium]|nr:MAG: M48 family metallopeptidase [Betaproteobacteria bacterium]TMH92578.1 MAG: M48 family metallopeptidase [Betaproteobacteria bacterium]
MRILVACLGLALLAPLAKAQTLPELGDTSGALLSPYLERKIGEQAMREIRSREPSFLDDPELTEYVNEVGGRIVAANHEGRQDFEFFMVRDNTINAFAMPGGFVGVHTGLLLAAQTESELAGVLAHEVAHVTQHHLARLLGKQEQMSIPTLVAMVLGIMAARSRPDLAQAVIAGAGASGIQSQLNYTRDFEREADRIGFQFLQQAGFDVGGMGSFFERMQKATRLYENNAPAYLRTHPLTSERIADMQNRAQTAVYKQAPDSIEFHLARAKVRAEQGLPREAVAYFEELVKEHRYAEEAGARYGLANALARAREFSRASSEIETVRKLLGTHPMVELLMARVRLGAGDPAGARDVLREALARTPNYRPLHYAYVDLLQGMGEHQAALAWLAELVKSYPRDVRIYSLQAKSYAASGKRLLHHQALAETYVLQGTLPAAIEQLQFAQKSGDGDFYQLSAVEARLRNLRSLQAEEKKTAKGN